MPLFFKGKKTVLSFLILISLLFSGTLFAEEPADIGSLEAGVYFKDYLPVGSMADYASNFAGGGILFEYHCAMPGFLKDLLSDRFSAGICGSFDFQKGFTEPFISSWNAANIFAGVFIDIPVTKRIIIQPCVEYGVQLDVVSSSRVANGVYPSQSLQLSPTIKYLLTTVAGNELNLIASPLWSVGFEKTHNADYLGLRIGVSMRFGKGTPKPEPVPVIEMEPVVFIEPEPVAEPEPVIEPEPEPEPEPVIEPEPEPEPVIEPVAAPEPVVVKKVEVKLNDDGTVAINIPTLAFKSNSAELTDAASNQKTIQQVFEILSDELYAEYKVIITGYVNPDGTDWTEDEKELALSRAETIRQSLISKGIDGNRLESRHGSGKTDNNEFNRRVEFFLTK